jgi:hypothetical protein
MASTLPLQRTASGETSAPAKADSPYTRRARYFDSANAFAIKYPPVPCHQFLAERDRDRGHSARSQRADGHRRPSHNAPYPDQLCADSCRRNLVDPAQGQWRALLCDCRLGGDQQGRGYDPLGSRRIEVGARIAAGSSEGGPESCLPEVEDALARAPVPGAVAGSRLRLGLGEDPGFGRCRLRGPAGAGERQQEWQQQARCQGCHRRRRCRTRRHPIKVG